jgi:hypothetical protein
MKCNLIKAFTLPQLILAAATLCLLLSSCTTSGMQTANVSSANPSNYTYNSGAREFQNRWPFGPAGYH